MSATISGLDKIIANVNRIAQKQLPRATATAINRIAKQAMKRSARQVAKDVKVPMKLVRARVKLRQKASVRKLMAQISVNRGNLPMFRLLEDSKRKVRVSKGQIRIGQHRIQRGFIQTLKNGRTHVMQRQGQARYPIDVVKIPLATPLTNAFHHELKDYHEQIKVELTAALGAALRR